jgi:hypothetical protein
LGLVTMLTPEPYAPYRRPPLTNGYLRGEASREDLPIESDGWFEANGVELRLLTSVDAIDRQRQIVITDEGEELSYDVCVLATGSEPIRPPVPGGDDPEILTMRTVENSTRLQDRVGEGDRALSALAMQTNVPPEHYEVLLVLDRCTDGTGERDGSRRRASWASAPSTGRSGAGVGPRASRWHGGRREVAPAGADPDGEVGLAGVRLAANVPVEPTAPRASG